MKNEVVASQRELGIGLHYHESAIHIARAVLYDLRRAEPMDAEAIADYEAVLSGARQGRNRLRADLEAAKKDAAPTPTGLHDYHWTLRE